jgi:hypothetical protein
MKVQAITFVMASLFSISAMATDSGGNSVYIDQTNADSSTVSITQTGSNNTVGDPSSLTSPSFVIDGNSMALTIDQTGMNNSITGNFIGGSSTATIMQDGNSNSTNLNMGNMGTSTGVLGLSVTGDNNTTALNIGVTHDSSNYKYDATITGASNALTSNINSKNTTNVFAVTGSSNAITTTQIGSNGTTLLGGHNINTSIIGSSNTLSVLQDGTTNPNSVTVNVTGSNTTTAIIQH